jgi:CheY-like chemotaxis protein
LKIYSEIGHRTTVRLYLPRATLEATKAADPEVRDVGHTHGDETVLVVEDDCDLRSLVVSQLKELGYRVLEAPDGPSALSTVKSDVRINLLFTDVVMPGGMTGGQLARETRQFRPRMRTLFTSGYTQRSIVHQGKLDPGAPLLSKPYKPQHLALKIREVLDAEE